MKNNSKNCIDYYLLLLNAIDQEIVNDSLNIEKKATAAAAAVTKAIETTERITVAMEKHLPLISWTEEEKTCAISEAIDQMNRAGFVSVASRMKWQGKRLKKFERYNRFMQMINFYVKIFFFPAKKRAKRNWKLEYNRWFAHDLVISNYTMVQSSST